MKNHFSLTTKIILLLAVGFFVVGGYLFTNFLGEMSGDLPQPAEMLDNLPDEPEYNAAKMLKPLLWLTQHLHFILPGLFALIFLTAIFRKFWKDFSQLKHDDSEEEEIPVRPQSTKTFVNGEEVTDGRSVQDILKEHLNLRESDSASPQTTPQNNTTFINGKEIGGDELTELLKGKLTDAQIEQLKNLGKKL